MEILGEVEAAGAAAPGADLVSRLVAERGGISEIAEPGRLRGAAAGRALAEQASPRARAESRAQAISERIEAVMLEAGWSAPRRVAHRARIWAGRAARPKTWEPEFMTDELGLIKEAVAAGARDGTAEGVARAGPELGRDPGEHVENE